MTTSTLRTLAAGAVLCSATLSAQSFTDATTDCGLDAAYLPMPNSFGAQIMTSGMAVSDYDNDGWDDILFAGGHLGGLKLFRNNGDGSFTDVAKTVGLHYHIPGGQPLWVDIDNDGHLDLFMTAYEKSGPAIAIEKPDGTTMTMHLPGGLAQPQPGLELVQQRNYLFKNNGDGTFTEKTKVAGLLPGGRWGAAAGDLNGDGALDLTTVSWSAHGGIDGLTRAFVHWNDGTGRFNERTPKNIEDTLTAGFSPHIVDMDADGDQDLFWAGDWSSSEFFRNDGGGKFSKVTDSIGYGTDENGMGSCVFDYDNDNDFDIFVTSIFSLEPFTQGGQGQWGISGNRMYQNDGTAHFVDTTDEAGVREGGWGWGADYGDLDNDGDFDLVHTNGFYPNPGDHDEFFTDPVRMFMNDGEGVFTEQAVGMGVDDQHQGRGTVLFDYNQDGALDILFSNHDIGLRMFKGDPNAITGNWLTVRLEGTTSNHFGIGARVWVDTGSQRILDKIEAGSNFMSQSPPDARFGLSDTATPVSVRVQWPNGDLQVVKDVAVNQVVTITQE